MSTSVHHVGVTVSDLEATLPFYRDVLDFDVLSRFSVDGEAFERGVGVDGASAAFAHLDGGDVRVELVEYDPAGEACRADRVNQTGAKHLGVGVDDLDAFYAELPDDVPTVSEPQTTASGTKILFVEDPEGNLVEVLET
jgi:catechol 2,3-dioxygenase-like lactoylglutathione lyase family enzyme